MQRSLLFYIFEELLSTQLQLDITLEKLTLSTLTLNIIVAINIWWT